MNEENILRPRTIRDHIKAFILALFMVLMPLLLLEGLLRIFDPWGIYFFDDMAMMANALDIDEQRQFYIPDGVYEFSRWTARIENGTRVLPSPTEDANCRIVLLGDSVTFGYGVNGDETWSYHLAKMFPNVEFRNTGVTAYNSYDVRKTHEIFSEADAYFYMVIYNDWLPNFNPANYNSHVNAAYQMPYIVRYGNFFLYRESEEKDTYDPEFLVHDPQLARFYDDIAEISKDSRVELFGFKDSLTTSALIGGGYDVYQLEYPNYPISYADGHLNAKGHEVLAEQLYPIMQDVIENHCS